jgi:diadenosine tetraphosphate (Ap4A) HIT family hydrolase
MTAQQLCAATTDTTPSPYMAGAPAAPGQPHASAGGEDPSQPWRWAVPPGQARPGGAGGGRERAPKRPRSDDAGPANTEATIFVRNLAFGASDDDIRAFFAPCGDVVEVRIGVGADGRPRGFAHVEFRTRDMADAAAGLNGTKLMDREVRVEPATERMERPARAPRVAAPGEPAPGCWFCLSNGKDTQLLVSIAAETYVALDKGALTPQHVLLIPVEHYPSSAALPLSAAEELWRYSSALRRCFAAALGGAQLVCFERHLALRGKGGNHAHINCVPLPAAAASNAKAAFEAAAQKAGFAFAALPPLADAAAAQTQLAAAVGGAEYFCVTLPDGERLVHALAQGERMNMQFGREVLAELLGTPDKADWRNCTIDATGEEQRAAKFKELFAKHDPFIGE